MFGLKLNKHEKFYLALLWLSLPFTTVYNDNIIVMCVIRGLGVKKHINFENDCMYLLTLQVSLYCLLILLIL